MVQESLSIRVLKFKIHEIKPNDSPVNHELAGFVPRVAVQIQLVFKY